ncbi:DNA-binding protein [Arsukibacterium ikkense]|uniref:DNA-binding protein n=1 Tax=Arsukibacterium ikkense TaxID=336831 RepID=A0A0M2V7A5_9GAMM|nr:TIGR02647 family protein [Arsukibacterium ikkense]KKO46712.1 DNA-binding protein [Arsukibacterium ikkense]
MPVTAELNAEIKILNLYNLDSQMEGLKVHKDADSETRAAIARLHQKGLLTQTDGGYLTDLGVHCAEHIQTAMRILAAR